MRRTATPQGRVRIAPGSFPVRRCTDYRGIAQLEARLVLIQEAAGSIPAAPAVAVADMAMHRIVAPDHAGSTPASHPAPWCSGSTQGFDPCGAGSSPAGAGFLN